MASDILVFGGRSAVAGSKEPPIRTGVMRAHDLRAESSSRDNVPGTGQCQAVLAGFLGAVVNDPKDQNTRSGRTIRLAAPMRSNVTISVSRVTGV
ncbi:unnamed protein product, partial [Iphiclides podalirius]